MLQAVEPCKRYGPRTVLAGVSFAVPPGECLGLCGPNGSGKSTLLRLLAQTETPDSGQVLWQGRPVRGDRDFLRRKLGYVPQQDALPPDATTDEVLRLWRGLCGLRGPMDTQLRQLLALDELRGLRCGALSGGMSRRVSLAMALCARPACLLLDESFAPLDADTRARLTAWLRQVYLPGGGCLVLCSHDEADLAGLCGARLRLENGRPV